MDKLQKYEALLRKLANKEQDYFVNEFESIAFKSIPETGSYKARTKGGGEEYTLTYQANVVKQAILDAVEITKEEYEKY